MTLTIRQLPSRGLRSASRPRPHHHLHQAVPSILSSPSSASSRLRRLLTRADPWSAPFLRCHRAALEQVQRLKGLGKSGKVQREQSACRFWFFVCVAKINILLRKINTGETHITDQQKTLRNSADRAKGTAFPSQRARKARELVAQWLGSVAPPLTPARPGCF